MTTKTKTKALQTKEETAIAPVGFDYGGEAGAGFETATSADLAIPFINLLQSNSPQVTHDEPEGAKAGMFLNIVTQELYPGDAGPVIIPVHKHVSYVEWIPKDEGGGYIGEFSPDAPEVVAAIAAKGSRFGALPFREGHELVETHCVYALLLAHDGKSVDGFAALNFSSTKLKPLRNWMTALYMLKGRPPMFANRARLRSVLQKNKKSQEFFNFAISPFRATWADSLIDPNTEGQLLLEAKKFRDMVLAGQAKADISTTEQVDSTMTAGEDDAAATPAKGGKIPF